MNLTPGTTYRRILITRMKFIGDIVLTTPVIRSVRTSCPGAYIAYMGDSNGVSLLEHNPCLDEIVPYDFSKPTILEQPRVTARLLSRKFDLAIDLFGNPRSALMTFLTRAKTRVGPDRRGRGRLYTIRVKDDGRPKTAIGFHNQFIRAAGIEPTSSRTEIFLTDAERREAKIYLQWQVPALSRETKKLIGLHPGATWPAKRWPPDRFAHLADRIAAKLGACVVVTAGPGDADAVNACLKSCVSDVKLLPVLPLRQLAAVISHLDAYVSNDAGPMHMAVAVGTPTVGIFGPGEEDIWFPYSREDGHVALRKDVPCHPCHLDFCNRSGAGYMECMNLLSVEEVFSAVASILSRH